MTNGRHSSVSVKGIVLLLGAAVLMAVGCARNPEVAKRDHLRRGVQYLEAGKYAEAAIELRNAVKVDPRFAEAYYHLGLSHRHLQHWPEAAEAFERTLELAPQHAQAAIELGEIYLMANKHDDARELAEQILDREPNHLAARILLAKSYLGEKKYSEASQEFTRATSLAPEKLELYLAKGLTEIGLRNFQAAEIEFRKALDLDRARVETYQNLANLYETLNRTKDAEEILLEGTRYASDNPRMKLALASFYFRSRRLEDVGSVLQAMKAGEMDSARLHRELGDFWMTHHEAARAVPEYQESLAAEPSWVVKKKLVGAYITLGDDVNAERWNRELLNENRDDHDARVFQGVIAFLKGKTKTAIEELERALARDPASAFAHYYLGSAYLAENKLNLSRKHLLQCVRLNDRFVQALARLGELSLRKNDPASATEYAKRVIALHPRLLDGYLLAASAALVQGEITTAERALQVASRLAPENHLVYEHRARLQIVKENYAQAEKESQKALASSPHPTQTLARMVRFYLGRGKAAQGLREVQAYMEAQGPSASLYELEARLHLARGAWSEAARAASRALALEPNRYAAHVHLGKAFTAQDRFAQAKDSYERAIQIDPQRIQAYLLLGGLSWQEGEFSQAVDSYRQAFAAFPDSLAAQTGLARALADAERELDWALSLAQQAKQQQPEAPVLSDTLGWVYHKKGLDDLAIPLLESCVEKRQENPLFRYHLGMAYLGMGRKAEAQIMLKEALGLGLKGPYAASAEAVLSSLDLQVGGKLGRQPSKPAAGGRLRVAAQKLQWDSDWPVRYRGV